MRAAPSDRHLKLLLRPRESIRIIFCVYPNICWMLDVESLSDIMDVHVTTAATRRLTHVFTLVCSLLFREAQARQRQLQSAHSLQLAELALRQAQSVSLGFEAVSLYTILAWIVWYWYACLFSFVSLYILWFEHPCLMR